MKLKIIYCFVLAFLIHPSVFGQKPDTNRMILGTWNYNTAYDTIAVAAINNPVDTLSVYPFVSRLSIKEKDAILFDDSKKLKAKWQINDSNQIIFFLQDGRVLKYTITDITPHSLELKEESGQGSTIGYKKK